MVIETPEKLNHYEFAPNRRRNSFTRLWDYIFGDEPQTFRLKRGKQFEAEARNFRSTIRSAAKEREYACLFSVEDDDTLVVLTVPAGFSVEEAMRAVRPTLDERPLARLARAKKAKKEKRARMVDLEDVDGLDPIDLDELDDEEDD